MAVLHPRPVKQDGKAIMPREVKVNDPRRSIGGREFSSVDRLTLRSDSRQNAKAGGNPIGGPRRDRQPWFEHVRVNFVGSAVEIDKGAGETGPHHWCAIDAIKQLIDQCVFSPAQLRHRQSCRGNKAGGIFAPGMWRCKDQR